jgi:hypothetical protein
MSQMTVPGLAHGTTALPAAFRGSASRKCTTRLARQPVTRILRCTADVEWCCRLRAGTVLIVFCWLGRAAEMAAATCTISSKWPKRITIEFPMPFPLHTKDGNFPSYLNHHDALDAKASGVDSGGMVLDAHRSKSPRFRRQTMLNLSARFSIPQGCCVPRKRNALANSPAKHAKCACAAVRQRTSFRPISVKISFRLNQSATSGPFGLCRAHGLSLIAPLFLSGQ